MTTNFQHSTRTTTRTYEENEFYEQKFVGEKHYVGGPEDVRKELDEIAVGEQIRINDCPYDEDRPVGTMAIVSEIEDDVIHLSCGGNKPHRIALLEDEAVYRPPNPNCHRTIKKLEVRPITVRLEDEETTSRVADLIDSFADVGKYGDKYEDDRTFAPENYVDVAASIRKGRRVFPRQEAQMICEAFEPRYTHAKNAHENRGVMKYSAPPFEYIYQKRFD